MRRFLAVALTAATFASTACGGGDSIGPNSVTGTYTLQSVNGAGLPAAILEDASYKLEVLSGSYTLSSNNTYSATASFKETDNGVVTPTTQFETGTYTLHGSSVTFTDSDDFQTDGTISGSDLTISAGGLTVRYSR